MRSLKRTVVVSLLAALSALAVAGGTSAYLSAISETTELLDLQQMQIARFVGDLSQRSGPDLSVAPHDPEDDYVVTVREPSIGLDRSTAAKPALPAPDRTGFTDFEDAGTIWRVYALKDGERTVQVAQQAVVRQELAQETALRATLPFVLALPLAGLVVEMVVRLAFRRMERLSAAVGRREDRDMSPLPIEDVPAEVESLVQALNDLLERLRHSMERERRFLADAAHELRTPLTALALQAGNLRGQEARAGSEERTRELESGIRRATAITDQLLRLARIEGTDSPRGAEDIRLDQLVLETVASLVPLAGRRQIDLGVAGNDPVVLRSDRDELRVLMEVLVDNALRYTRKGGTIDVTLREEPGRIVLSVVDDGPGVSECALPRLRERFFRSPQGPEDHGSGLGLAIADAIARKHGGELHLANRTDRSGFAASLVLPAHDAPPRR